MSTTQEFLDFIAASPSSYHAAEEVARTLVAAGFSRQDESAEWSAAPGGHVMVRGGLERQAGRIGVGADNAEAGIRAGAFGDIPCHDRTTPDHDVAAWCS